MQYDWLMDLIDRPMWEKACKFFAQKWSWWTDTHTKITLQAVCTTRYKLCYSYAGVRLMDVWVSGTPSGHGPKTTDGNTRRHRFVQDFFLDKVYTGPRFHYKRLLTGDDFYMAGPRFQIE